MGPRGGCFWDVGRLYSLISSSSRPISSKCPSRSLKIPPSSSWKDEGKDEEEATVEGKDEEEPTVEWKGEEEPTVEEGSGGEIQPIIWIL